MAKRLKRNRNRVKNMPRGKKVKVSITIDGNLKEWVDREINEYRFFNVSHCVETALVELKERREREKAEKKGNQKTVK